MSQVPGSPPSGNMTDVASRRRSWFLLRRAGARYLVVAITFDEGLASPEMAAFLEYDRTTAPDTSSDRRFQSLEAAVQTVLDILAGNTPVDFADYSPLSVLYRLQYGIAGPHSVGTDNPRRPETSSSNLEQDNTESQDDDTSSSSSRSDPQTSDTSRSTNTPAIGVAMNNNNVMAGHQPGLPMPAQDIDLLGVGAWDVDNHGAVGGMDWDADLDLDHLDI